MRGDAPDDGSANVTMTKRRAFTLIELLAVIAIIGLLVGLLLPAVQSARESSRRTQCHNNMRQWGIAMQQHESSYDRFPPGSLSSTYNASASTQQMQRRTFVVSLWPYMDEQKLLGTYDILQPLWAAVNESAIDAAVPMYYCPSDRPGAKWRHTYNMARGNYVCNWGNNRFRTRHRTGPFTNYEFNNATFSDPETRRQYGRPAGAFVDGLSNTVFMSEIRVPPNDTDQDSRGQFMNNIACGPTFMTMAVPNPPSPSYPITPMNRPDVDHCYCRLPAPPTEPAACESNADGLAGSGITVVSPGNPDGWNAARSRHPTGVSALLGDGSTRFVSDRVSLPIWQQYGTIAGSELVEPLP